MPLDAASPNAAPQLLIIDDDPGVVQALEAFFSLEGWDVASEMTGEAGLERLEADHAFDLILLDVNLPGLSGFDVLERAQEHGLVTPVLMISTSAEDDDRLHALGLGAQDYLTKPFEPEALLERVKQVIGLGAEPAPAPSEQRLGQAILDLDAGRAVRDGEEVALSEADRALLDMLLRHRGQVVSRKRLAEALGVEVDQVWFSFTRRAVFDALEEHVERLRELIERDPRKPALLTSVYAQGYRLEA